MLKIKILFNTIFKIINVIFIFLYLWPGSILGWLLYGKMHKQPQLTSDFLSISSNHVYAFLVLSLLGLIAYYKSKKLFILNYLLLSAIILEVLHLVIPNRSFQYSDLFGNIIGVLLSILLFNIYYIFCRKE
tara:strand:+ start:895 stop:1287 length:393 start_codon:yes stop_codon:yes gene_type:complete